jgi:hypothetical protein
VIPRYVLATLVAMRMLSGRQGEIYVQFESIDAAKLAINGRPLVRRQADLRHVHPRRHHASSQVTGTTGVPVRKSKNGWLSTGGDDEYQYYRRAYSVCSSYLEVMYIFAKSTIMLYNYNNRRQDSAPLVGDLTY